VQVSFVEKIAKFGMIPLIRVIRPIRALTRCNYSTSSDQLLKLGHNVDPSELLSDEEIEFEVNLLIRMFFQGLISVINN
jgi:hypothetical protein